VVIYAEYLFIENLITGGLILTLTGRISGIRVKRIPLVLGSILCGIYSFILFWDHLLPQIAIFSKVAFSVLVVLLVFPTKKIKRLARTILIFYIISLALGLADADFFGHLHLGFPFKEPHGQNMFFP
jgi:tryptophan-rich sensory protein